MSDALLDLMKKHGVPTNAIEAALKEKEKYAVVSRERGLPTEQVVTPLVKFHQLSDKAYSDFEKAVSSGRVNLTEEETRSLYEYKLYLIDRKIEERKQYPEILKKVQGEKLAKQAVEMTDLAHRHLTDVEFLDMVTAKQALSTSITPQERKRLEMMGKSQDVIASPKAPPMAPNFDGVMPKRRGVRTTGDPFHPNYVNPEVRKEAGLKQARAIADKERQHGINPSLSKEKREAFMNLVRKVKLTRGKELLITENLEKGSEALRREKRRLK